MIKSTTTLVLCLLFIVVTSPTSVTGQTSDEAPIGTGQQSNFTPSNSLNSCGQAGEIYCNGELVNSSGTGPGGEDESVLQNETAPVMTSFGVACTPEVANTRCSDEFVVPTGLIWDISNFVFFAYQTNEATIPTMTGLTLRIFSGGDPTTGTLLCGDTTTNVLTSTSDPSILRVTETDAGANVARRIQQMLVSVPTDCPALFVAGTYWLDWSNSGSGASGPWTPPIASTHTIPLSEKVDGRVRTQVQSVTGNAVQSGDGGVTYAPVLDGASLEAQGLPFNILATVLPVELIDFTAQSSGESVLLNWSTASETNNSGFEIQHWIENGFESVDFVEGYGTTLEQQNYSYSLRDLGAGRHQFRLKQIDFDGAFEYSDMVEVLIDVPQGFVVYNAYPNPFNPSSNLEFIVAEEQVVDVTLLDIFGKKVMTVFSSTVPANQLQQVQLNAENLPSGSYLIRVSGQNFTNSQIVQLLK